MGFCEFEYVPSPNDQFQDVAVPLFVESVNKIVLGKLPLVEFAENDAFNGYAVMYEVLFSQSDPPAFVALKLTEYVVIVFPMTDD